MSARPRSAPNAAADAPAALIGRSGELTAGRVALQGRGLVICGPPGSGRSALADALAPGAHRVVATAATASQPLWAFRGLLAAEPGPFDAGTVVEQARRTFGSARRPPVLVVDDVDHLDDASSAVLLRLVEDEVVRLVGVRLNNRAASEAVAALWRQAGVVRLDLAPMSDEDLTSMVVSLLDGPVDGRTLSTLVDLAAGSPYLAREAVRGSRASGALTRAQGLWRLVADPTLSADVADRAAAVLRPLSTEALAAAEKLALADRLPLDTAIRAAGAPALEELERHALVAVEGGPPAATVRLASPVVARHLAASLPRLARLRIAGALADAARSSGAAEVDGPLRLRATVWDLDAGRPGNGPDLLRAARLALDEGDPVLADRLATASAEVDDSTEAVLLQSWCADERGEAERSARVLRAHRPEGDAAVVAVAIRRAEQRFWTGHDAEGARVLLAEAAETTGGPWPLAARAQQAVFEVLQGHATRALAASTPLLDHVEPLVASTASLAAALALATLDLPDEAAAVADAALERLAGPTPALYIDPGVHVIALGWAHIAAGRLAEADELTEAVYRHTLGRPGRQAQGWAALLRSRVLVARGRPRDGRAVALEAEQVWAAAGVRGLARWSATAAALAAAEQGDLAALQADLERLEGHPAGPFGLFEPEADRARAWRDHLAGGPDDAVDTLTAVIRSAGADGVTFAAAAAHDLVRLGAPEPAAAAFATLAPGSRLTETRRALAEAASEAAAHRSAGTDPPRTRDLEDVADDLDRLGAAGWAAEARALAAMARASRIPAVRDALAATLEGTGLATPPLHRLGRAAVSRGLTAREEQVVALASDGRSNREIAQELVVSVRTVENHLHRAFAKLGVTSRAELARAGPSPPG